MQPRLTKRQRRLAEKGYEKEATQRVPSLSQLHLELKPVGPITDNQIKAFQAYAADDHLLMHGSPGTGKSFLSFALGLDEIFNKKTKRTRIIIIRSAQASKAIGFLPGDEKQKMAVYKAPYKSICNELFNRGDAWDILEQKGVVEFHSTSFLRGATFENAIIILDEVQNLSYQESKTVLTRTGNHSRVIVCGDLYQDDLTSARFNEVSGFKDLLKITRLMDNFTEIEFGIDDIVRSGFVRSFIIAEHEANRRHE